MRIVECLEHSKGVGINVGVETEDRFEEGKAAVYSEKTTETDYGGVNKHQKDFSVDTNDSDASEILPSYVDGLRASSPLRCLTIHGMKIQNGQVVSTSPPNKVERSVVAKEELDPSGKQEKSTETKNGSKGIPSGKQEKSTETKKGSKGIPSARKGAAPAKQRERKIRFTNFACLLEAALEGDFEEVKHLIEKEKLHPDTCNADGVTSLHCAAGMSRIDMVEYLLAQGANVNVCDDHGWTPLHSAAYTNSREITELLLSHGADVEAMDSQGQAPIGLATDFELIRILGEVVRRKNSHPFVAALYDFESTDEEELNLKRGDQMYIVARQDPEWWTAKKGDQTGYVPRKYVQ